MNQEKVKIISELLLKCNLVELEDIASFIMRQVSIERRKRSNNLMIPTEVSKIIIKALENDNYYWLFSNNLNLRRVNAIVNIIDS